MLTSALCLQVCGSAALGRVEHRLGGVRGACTLPGLRRVPFSARPHTKFFPLVSLQPQSVMCKARWSFGLPACECREQLWTVAERRSFAGAGPPSAEAPLLQSHWTSG